MRSEEGRRGRLKKPSRRSPWLATYLVIGVLLSSELVYLGASEEIQRTIPGPFMSRGRIDGGFRITWWTPSPLEIESREWGDISIVLESRQGMQSIWWDNLTNADLTGTHNKTWHYGSAKRLGDLEVWLNVTDYEGDGQFGRIGYLFLTTGGPRFSGSYTLLLAHEPSNLVFFELSFSG